MNLNNFHYSYVLANQMFGIEVDEIEFEEIGMVAFGLIGNKRIRIYHATLDVDCDDGSVLLPCNADIIEAVTRCGEDFQNVTNYLAFNNYNSAFAEGYIEVRKTNKSPLYSSGGFLKYHQVEDKLYVDPHIRKVLILYKGVELDEEGLPMLTDKEALAIAYYIAYILLYKKAILTLNADVMRLAGVLKQDYEKKIDAARVDKEYWTTNDMNEILDVKTSWNRKLYGKSYKPIK